jgi:hypothetical protein
MDVPGIVAAGLRPVRGPELFSSHVMEPVDQVCEHVSVDLVGPRSMDEEVLSWPGSSSS